jgi:hypothetical protein
VEFRELRFAAPILHIRRRLAWKRFASHACRSWRFTASACELDAVEEPSCHYNDNSRISGGIRTPSHCRPVDAHRGSFGCVARNLADHDDSRRPMGHDFARNHCLRSRDVRTGSMVSRCSPVWVEARGTCTAQNQLQLLKNSFINHRNFWLNGGDYFPSLECAIGPVVGLFANGTRWTIRSSGNWALNSSSIGERLNAR